MFVIIAKLMMKAGFLFIFFSKRVMTLSPFHFTKEKNETKNRFPLDLLRLQGRLENKRFIK
jgi:hypothetical protein